VGGGTVATEAWLIAGGRVVDPASGRDGAGDLLLADGRVAAIGPALDGVGARRLDARGKVVCPGLIDTHVHLREPGFEYKETIASGTRAAVAGGFAAVCAMPNTRPAIDRPERVEDLLRRAATAACRVYPIGAATVDLRGEVFTDFGALKEAGCVAVTDDAFPLQRGGQMAEALRRVARAGLPFIAHCELESLSHGAPVDQSARPGGQSALSEAGSARLWLSAYERVAREGLAPRLHVAHLSSRLAVVALARALPRAGAEPSTPSITAETAPHYLSLTSDAVATFGADAKMNPPLRSAQDRDALQRALADGRIDVIATDHAPHAPEEKAGGLASAPFGIVGLETALGVCLSDLVGPGVLSLGQLVTAMSRAPAEAFGLPGGRLAVGDPGDVTVIDPDAEWTVEPARFQSEGRACPWAGRRLRGRPYATFVRGELRMLEGAVR
jgi:dihydroorotase